MDFFAGSPFSYVTINYECGLCLVCFGRPAQYEYHNISGGGGYRIFGIISLIPAIAHFLEKTRSTHIARKLDGEGGSPRYMAPECAWESS